MSGPDERAGAFDASRECFEDALGWLAGPDATSLTHAELEDQLDCRGRELLRRMCQDHVTVSDATETRREVVRDAEAVTHGAVETGHRRPLATIVGEVAVEPLAYRHRRHPNLYPADAVLNLPAEHHSHGLLPHHPLRQRSSTDSRLTTSLYGSRTQAEQHLLDGGGAGGARTHDPRIMSSRSGVRRVPNSAAEQVFRDWPVRRVPARSKKFRRVSWMKSWMDQSSAAFARPFVLTCFALMLADFDPKTAVA